MKVVRRIKTDGQARRHPWLMGSLKNDKIQVELAVPTNQGIKVFLLTEKESQKLMIW